MPGFSDTQLLSNAELLARCRDGDERAWRALIDRFGSLMLSVPQRYGLRGAVVDDIFSDVCLALVNSLRTIRDPSRLAGWIVRTTTRCCWNAIQKRKKTALPSGVAHTAPEPVEVAEQLEAEQLVREAVAHLPKRCRTILEQLYFVSPTPSYDEVAARTALPRGSIGPTRRRCLDKMRAYLEPVAVGFADAEAAVEVPHA